VSDATYQPEEDATASDQIDSYLARIDFALKRAGASANHRSDVVDNMRSQILEMIAAFGTDEPRPDQIAAMLDNLDKPEDFAAEFMEDAVQVSVKGNQIPPHSSSAAISSAPYGYSDRFHTYTRGGTAWFTLYAITLPLIALLVELTTRVCTNSIFDPIPTLGHTLCVAFVPATYLFGLILIKRQILPWPRTLLIATGAAAGISLVYIMPFVPLLLFSVVGILFMGIGLLPFAPLAAFFGGLSIRKRLKKLASNISEEPLPDHLFGVGVLLGIALITLCYLPAYLINTNIDKAATGTATEQRKALDKLHFYRAQDDVLALAYRTLGNGRGFTGTYANMGPLAILWNGSSKSIAPAEAAAIYYRLTGKPYNSVPPPTHASGLFDTREPAFERDPSLRDGTVGWIDTDLTLKSSRIDAVADSATATGYVEWTMEFHNTTGVQREARSQILLPPGGVVSRLTLWVNGEEREAAFSGRSEVKAAYENVVAQRRDPVLVTTSGPDRILMQCFPVPAGGDMKIRIGITHPLSLHGKEKRIVLPRHIDRNYDVPDQTRHYVWLEADGVLAGKIGDVEPKTTAEGLAALTGNISEDQLSNSNYITLAGKPVDKQLIADLREPARYVIEQATTVTSQAVPSKVIMVLDTSIPAADLRDDIVAACSKLAQDTKIVFYQTGVEASKSGPEPQEFTPAQLGEHLKQIEFQGGQDNIPALTDAWQTALDNPGSAILWVHSPQAVVLTSPDALIQLIQRSKKAKPVFYELLLAAGPDRVLGSLERHLDIQFIPGIGTMALKELVSLFSGSNASTSKIEIIRTRRELAAGESVTSTTAATGHAARLWAFDKAMRMFRGQRHIEEARDLAVSYQLVTPFTGAVVLETKQQYDEAGLTPVDPRTVPTIPEPEEWALIVLALILLSFGAWKARRFRGRIAV